jgi:hypothetical protein
LAAVPDAGFEASAPPTVRRPDALPTGPVNPASAAERRSSKPRVFSPHPPSHAPKQNTSRPAPSIGTVESAIMFGRLPDPTLLAHGHFVSGAGALPFRHAAVFNSAGTVLGLNEPRKLNCRRIQLLEAAKTPSRRGSDTHLAAALASTSTQASEAFEFLDSAAAWSSARASITADARGAPRTSKSSAWSSSYYLMGKRLTSR